MLATFSLASPRSLRSTSILTLYFTPFVTPTEPDSTSLFRLACEPLFLPALYSTLTIAAGFGLIFCPLPQLVCPLHDAARCELEAWYVFAPQAGHVRRALVDAAAYRVPLPHVRCAVHDVV